MQAQTYYTVCTDSSLAKEQQKQINIAVVAGIQYS